MTRLPLVAAALALFVLDLGCGPPPDVSKSAKNAANQAKRRTARAARNGIRHAYDRHESDKAQRLGDDGDDIEQQLLAEALQTRRDIADIAGIDVADISDDLEITGVDIDIDEYPRVDVQITGTAATTISTER